jgi:hypothetical protein
MNKAIYFAVLIILTSNHLFAQEMETFPALKDTVIRHRGINPVLKIEYMDYQSLPLVMFSQAHTDHLMEGDTSTLWLRTEMALSFSPEFGRDNLNMQEHMMLPFYEQYLENSKIDPIRYVLAIA